MKGILLAVLLILIASCGRVTPDDARAIAYQRLSAYADGPSLEGEALRSALAVSEQSGGVFLVEVRDEPRNLLWAVIVQPSGAAEITRMAIDG